MVFYFNAIGSPVEKEKLPVRLLTAATVLFLILAGSPLADMNTQAANAQSNPYASDTTPPASITNLQNTTYAQTYINWTWTDPSDSDFSKVMIYLNGTFQTNITKGVKYYNASGLTPAKMYNISTRTVDTSGNINSTWINKTSITAPVPDTIPPASLTNLTNITYTQNYINWTWTDPTDPDFSKVMIYLNGTFQTNVTNGTQYYNATGLTADTQYDISTQTIDTSGNINLTWVNRTARTAPTTSELRIITVNASGSADYTKIQDAIDNARTGDIILVQSGTYYESVNVTKQLTLQGMDTGGEKPVVDASGNGSAITLSIDGITMKGFIATNSSGIFGDAGIRVISNNNILNNNIASNNIRTGFGLSSSNNILISNAANDNPTGIVLSHSTNNTIISNIINNNSIGLSLNSSSNNTIYNNYFNNTKNCS